MLRRTKENQRSRALAAVPLFEACTDEELERLGELATESVVREGQVLCAEGAIGRELMVLLDGEATVETSDGRSSRAGVGDFVGELALLDNGRRSATVTMATDGTVLVLSSVEFRQLLHDVPRIAVGMLPMLGARLRAAMAESG